MSLTKWIVKHAVKYLIAGIGFLALSPFLYLEMKPLDDFRYHLFGKQLPGILDPADDSHGIQVCRYAEIDGTLDKSSISYEFGFRGLELQSVSFRMEGHPENFFFFVPEGPTLEILQSRLDAYNAENPDDFNEKEISGQLTELLSSLAPFRGRTYSSDSFFDNEFGSYYGHKRHFNPEGYYLVFLDLSYNATSILDVLFGKDKVVYWMFAVDEIPSIRNLENSNGIIFLLGCLFGILGILVFGFRGYRWRKFKRDNEDIAGMIEDLNPEVVDKMLDKEIRELQHYEDLYPLLMKKLSWLEGNRKQDLEAYLSDPGAKSKGVF